MKRKKKAFLRIVLFGIILWLIIRHVVNMYDKGIYLEMLSWVMTDKVYVTVLYNLGIMMLLSIICGVLMNNITTALGWQVASTDFENWPVQEL